MVAATTSANNFIKGTTSSHKLNNHQYNVLKNEINLSFMLENFSRLIKLKRLSENEPQVIRSLGR